MSTSHLGTDWHDQWNRLLRHYQAVSTPDLDSYDHDRVVDRVVSFCKECDAVPEWLINSGFPRDQVHAVISASPALRWARDIANGMGHFKLSPLKSTTTHGEWTTTSTIITLHFAENPPSAEFWVFIDTATGEKLSPRTLADGCVNAWQDYLSRELP